MGTIVRKVKHWINGDQINEAPLYTSKLAINE
jgi:hypothetical protein